MAEKKSKAVTVEYHVVPEDGGRRWNVERDDFTGQFAFEVNTAIGLATAIAAMCGSRPASCQARAHFPVLILNFTFPEARIRIS